MNWLTSPSRGHVGTLAPNVQRNLLKLDQKRIGQVAHRTNNAEAPRSVRARASRTIRRVTPEYRPERIGLSLIVRRNQTDSAPPDQTIWPLMEIYRPRATTAQMN
jgi:hypothetical protein